MVIVQLSVMASRRVSVLLVVALLGHALCVPVEVLRLKRGYVDNELNSSELTEKQDLVQESSNNRLTRDESPHFGGESKEEGPSKVGFDATTEKVEYATPVFDSDEDEDDDDFEPMNTAPAGGGSNLFSLLRLANALFPSSSGANPFIWNLIRGYLNNQFKTNSRNPYNPGFLRREDVSYNLVDIDDIKGLKPPTPSRQEIEESVESESESESDESESAEDGNGNGENGNENGGNGNGGNANGGNGISGSEDSNSKTSDEDDYSDEPPEGDGQGGGLLGVLAGLSGGEDGSDLGTLLATISGIVANLSGGEGFDLNSVIGSGIGLFVGLLSQGEENPGEVIASYFQTSLDSITGGGSQNNGAFFGTFLSKLLRGISAQGKTPSDEPASPIWTFKMDLLRAFLQFGTSLLGKASSSSSSTSSASG